MRPRIKVTKQPTVTSKVTIGDLEKIQIRGIFKKPQENNKAFINAHKNNIERKAQNTIKGIIINVIPKFKCKEQLADILIRDIS